MNLQLACDLFVSCFEASKDAIEKEDAAVDLRVKSVFLRISVVDEAVSNFSYSIDGKKFDSLGDILSGERECGLERR